MAGTLRYLSVLTVAVAAIAAGGGGVIGVATASGRTVGSCAPPRGPGDNLVHSGQVRVRHVSCPAARRLILACDRFSYGHSGHCRAIGHRWYCTSHRAGPLGSSEACSAPGGRRVSWVWLD